MFHKNSADSPRGGRVDDGAPSGSAQEQQIRAREQPTAQEQDHDKLQEQVEHRGHAVSDSNKKKKTRVGFLGPPGNFTHLAVLQDYQDCDSFEHVPLVNISDVFQHVEERKIDFGIVPFENSTNGSVTFTLDLFADRYQQYASTTVCGESFVEVHHNVLGRSTAREHEASSGTATPTTTSPNPLKPRTKPLTDLSHIKQLYSHPQAWGQCEAFLSTYLKGVERHDSSSTSKAAEIVSKDVSNTSASISCISAATAYNLDILAKGIEDKANNKTRFLTLRRSDAPSDGDLPNYLSPRSVGSGWKSFMCFTVDHNRPGALAEALQVFPNFGLNLTSINSRPSGKQNWHYIFFVEFMGREEDDPVRQAMRKLEEIAQGCRIIGSFRDRSGE